MPRTCQLPSPSVGARPAVNGSAADGYVVSRSANNKHLTTVRSGLTKFAQRAIKMALPFWLPSVLAELLLLLPSHPYAFPPPSPRVDLRTNRIGRREGETTMAVGMATESLRWPRLLAFGLLVLVGWFGVEQIASSRYILSSCEIWLDLGFNGIWF